MVTVLQLACIFYALGWRLGLSVEGLHVLHLPEGLQFPPTVQKDGPWVHRNAAGTFSVS